MKYKFLLLTFLFGSIFVTQAQIKVGIIGLDTSHSPAFVKMLNSDNPKEEFKGFKVVAAYPYGSKSIKSSYDRIPGYIEQVEKLGVEIMPSILELLKKVDCVMLETNDGNLHLEQAYEVLKSGKILFIDKPLAASLAESIAIYELSKRYNVPIFSSSSLRYIEHAQKIREGAHGQVLGADCFSPHRQEPSHPDFGWYGIHGVEMLFTVMGTGCVSVSRMSADSTDVVVGKWDDGRIGTFRALQQGKSVYGGTVFSKSGAVDLGKYQGYEPLLKEILQFFKTAVSPVSEKETLEIFTFMEASNESKRRDGKIVSMDNTYRKGVKKAKKLIRKLN